MYIYKYIYVYIYTYTYTHLYMEQPRYAHTGDVTTIMNMAKKTTGMLTIVAISPDRETGKCINTSVNIYVYIYVYAHIYIHLYIHTYIHTNLALLRMLTTVASSLPRDR